ncbi:hypothetical protein DFH27DRAFT_652564 [Peziza echinospora]|nr:hypothetical protein DFH27DRAFT_652564 [Peziza echinospora]
MLPSLNIAAWLYASGLLLSAHARSIQGRSVRLNSNETTTTPPGYPSCNGTFTEELILDFDDVEVEDLSTQVPNPYHGFVFTTDGARNVTPGSFIEVIQPCEKCSGYSLVVSPPNVLIAATGKLVIEPEPSTSGRNASALDCTFDLLEFSYTPGLPQWPANYTMKYGAYVEITGSDNSTYDFFTLQWDAPTIVGKGSYSDEVLNKNRWNGLKWLNVKTWAIYPNGTFPFAGSNDLAFGIDDLQVDKVCKCKSQGTGGGHGGYGQGGHKGGKGGKGGKGDDDCAEGEGVAGWQSYGKGYIKRN